MKHNDSMGCLTKIVKHVGVFSFSLRKRNQIKKLMKFRLADMKIGVRVQKAGYKEQNSKRPTDNRQAELR